MLTYTQLVESSKFKDFMSQIPANVAVVASSCNNEIQACTISSLTSYDVINPSVILVLQKYSRTLDAIRQTRTFSANLLDLNQSSISEHFSSRIHEDLQDKSEFFESIGELSIPSLKSCRAVSFCKLESIIDLENAAIVLGRVIGLFEKENNRPLVYFDRKYFTLQALES